MTTIYTTVSQARRWDRSQGQDGSERPSGSPYIAFGMNRTVDEHEKCDSIKNRLDCFFAAI